MEKLESAKPDAHIEPALVLVPGPAKHRAYLRVGIPTAIGLAILMFHSSIEAQLANPHWAEIINHLGIAFLVSGIVVFGYEWRSEQKNLMALTAKLSNVLDKSDRMAVRNALVNIAGPHGYRFSESFLTLAESIARLGDEWTAQSYREFLAHYLEELADKASGLADMNQRLRRKTVAAGSEYRLLMPNAAKLIDVLVMETTHALTKHPGKYYAVSDASTWDNLTAFSSASSESLVKVPTKRIFVLGRDSDLSLDPKRVHDILREHFKQARESNGNYEMKITSDDEYRHMPAIPELSGAVHFGIWAPHDLPPIAVFAIDANLSNFRIAPATQEMINGFRTMWARLDDLSGRLLGESKVPVGEAILQDYLLAYRVKRLGHGARYRGVSKMAVWRDGGMKKFFAASCDAIRKKELNVKRIFVLDAPEQPRDRYVLDVIRSHARVEKETKLYQWRICLSEKLPDALKPPGIAMFADSDGRGHELREIAITAAPDDQPQSDATRSIKPPEVDARPQTFLDRQRAFDDFWETLADREALIRLLFRGHAEEVLRIIANPDADLPGA